MKITYYDGRKVPEGFTLADLIEGSCTYAHASGKVEQAAEVADNVAKRFGILIQYLFENNVLHERVVAEMIGYPFFVAKE